MLVGQREYINRKKKYGVKDKDLYLETGVSLVTIGKSKKQSVTYDTLEKLVNGLNRIIERRL